MQLQFQLNVTVYCVFSLQRPSAWSEGGFVRMGLVFCFGCQQQSSMSSRDRDPRQTRGG